MPSIKGMHELHVWQLAGNRIIASAHVQCQSPQEYMQMANDIKRYFHDMGIHSTTIQPEFIEVNRNLHTREKDQSEFFSLPYLIDSDLFM